MRTLRSWAWTLATLALVANAACGSDDTAFEDDGGGGDAQGVKADPSCDGRNWRDPSADIACPTAPGCGCATSEVCCLAVNNAAGTVSGSSCTELSACADVAFSCDGPEDCAEGQSCCAEGLGSTCIDEGTCIGSDAFVLCRSDEDCGIFECIPAQPGTYYEDVLGFCD